MTQPSPAYTLRAAAEALRRHATAAEAKRPGRWYPGAAGSVISPRKGGVDYVTPHTISDGAEVSRYIAVMAPGVGLALADWLAETASLLDAHTHPKWQETVAPQPLAVARAILGDQP